MSTLRKLLNFIEELQEENLLNETDEVKDLAVFELLEAAESKLLSLGTVSFEGKNGWEVGE